MSAVGRRLLGAGLALGLAVLLGGGLGGLAAALDFNGASLEDWLGPFREQGRALVEGRAELVEAFVYPPSAAVLLAPLGTLGPSGAEALGWFVQLLCVGLLAALGPRLAGVRWSGILDLAFGLAVGLCVPVLHSVHWGQLGAPLAVLVLLWLLAGRSEGGSDEQAGRVRVARARIEQLDVLAHEGHAAGDPLLLTRPPEGHQQLVDGSVRAGHQLGPGVVEVLPLVLGDEDRKAHGRFAAW